MFREFGGRSLLSPLQRWRDAFREQQEADRQPLIDRCKEALKSNGKEARDDFVRDEGPEYFGYCMERGVLGVAEAKDLDGSQAA